MSEEMNGTVVLERPESAGNPPNIVMTRTAEKEQSEVYAGAAPVVKNRPFYAFFKRLADFNCRLRRASSS